MNIRLCCVRRLSYDCNMTVCYVCMQVRSVCMLFVYVIYACTFVYVCTLCYACMYVMYVLGVFNYVRLYVCYVRNLGYACVFVYMYVLLCYVCIFMCGMYGMYGMCVM